MAISYAKFKRTFGNLGITEWVKFNWLSNAGFGRNIYNKVVETGYNPLAYVNNELYNRITKSINIWDEEWEVGGLSSVDGSNYTDNNRIRSKNFIPVFPNTTYYFKMPSNKLPFKLCFYDINKIFISYIVVGNSQFTTPTNCAYMRFTENSTDYGTTYNHDICINISNPYINGNYFPYFEGEKFLVLVGEVDLGSLNWNYVAVGNGWWQSTSISGIKYVSSNLVLGNITAEKYKNRVASGFSIAKSGEMALDVNTIKVNTGSNTTQPSGILNYELATPVLIDL